MEQRLSLVTLGARDLQRARAFYESMGWHTGAAPEDDVVFFQAGGMIVALWDRGRLGEDAVVDDSGGWGGVTLAYNARSAEEVDAVFAEARAAGATIGKEPGPTFWGGYSGVFVDPEGHPWEVAHNPGWTIDDDGSVRLGPQVRPKVRGVVPRKRGHNSERLAGSSGARCGWPAAARTRTVTA